MIAENTSGESQRFGKAAPSRVDPTTPSVPSSSLYRIAVVAAFTLGGFLLGFVPMSWTSADYRAELDSVSRTLRANVLQNDLATATINARRGEFEEARRQTSAFFTDLDATLQRDKSRYTPEQNQALQSILGQRDDIITTLARNDPSSGDRLTGLYFNYLQVKNSATPVKADSK